MLQSYTYEHTINILSDMDFKLNTAIHLKLGITKYITLVSISYRSS